MTRPLLATIPETRCPPTSRYFADPETWRAIAASPEFTFTALWAEPGAVIALLETNGAPVLVSVAVEQGFYPALSPFHPHATAFERMLRDLWGYNAVGATDARPMLDFGHWPVATPMARPTASGPPERPTSGFAHKGTLALLRGKSPRAAARFAARLDGEATVSHSIASPVPPRRTSPPRPAPSRSATSWPPSNISPSASTTSARSRKPPTPPSSPPPAPACAKPPPAPPPPPSDTA